MRYEFLEILKQIWTHGFKSSYIWKLRAYPSQYNFQDTEILTVYLYSSPRLIFLPQCPSLLLSFPQSLLEWSTLSNDANRLDTSLNKAWLHQKLKSIFYCSFVSQCPYFNLTINEWLFFTFTFCIVQGLMRQLQLRERSSITSAHFGGMGGQNQNVDTADAGEWGLW